MADFDFSQFETMRELREHLVAAEAEIDRRKTERRQQMEMEIREHFGESLEEFLGLQKEVEGKKSAAILKRYRNPNNHEEIIEVGKGKKQPDWFKELKKDKSRLEEAEVKD